MVRRLLSGLVIVALGTWLAGLGSLATTVDQPNQVLSGGFASGHFDEAWDLTAGDMYIVFTVDLTGVIDADPGGDGYGGDHAWAEFGVRTVGYGDFNPTAGTGVWLSTDYNDWLDSSDTFAPDAGSPILDVDDKLILQRAGGSGEASYNLPMSPPSAGANHRIWFDRDGVDPWQATNALAVDGGTYNTGGTYNIVIRLHAVDASHGEAYMSVNGLDQGFETDGDWSTMELSPAGMTFTGDMSQLQVFYGMYGYGATHSVAFGDISLVLTDVVYVDPSYVGLSEGDRTADGHFYDWDAFESIQDGIDGVSHGVVMIAPATYAPTATLTIGEDDIALMGSQANVDPRPSAGSARVPGGPNETIVTGNGTLSRVIYIDADNVEINGLEVRSGTGDMIRQSNAHTGTAVRYCIIHDGLGDEGVQLKQCTNGIIEYNYVFDIDWAGDALNFADSTNCRIQFNEIHDVSSDNAAIYVYGSENTSIVGNLIYDLPNGEGIKLGTKSGGDEAGVGGVIADNEVFNVGGSNNDDGIAIYMSHVLVSGNEVYNDTSENGAIYLAFGISDILLERNVIRDNSLLTHKPEWAGATGGVLIGSGVDVSTVGLHYNSIHGNTPYGVSNQASSGEDLDATLNWWGSADGPTHTSNPEGDGDAVTDHVIFSPWLGIDPDADPGTVGVQMISPMLIVVDNVGTPPADGYLDAAIAGANDLVGSDVISVRPGSYDVDQEIEDGVAILSTEGACETTLTGEIEIGTAGVLLGEIRNGFRIDGNVRVLSGQDASLSALHWNDIYGMVENAGIGTLDATYNFWGAGGPVEQTIGSVHVYPDLPLSSCTIIGYIDDYGMTVAEALAFGGLMADGYSEGFAKTVMEIVARCGVTNEQALALIFEYNHGRVKSALRRTRTCAEFYELLEGYAMPAGAGGAAPESVVVGELSLIHI